MRVALAQIISGPEPSENLRLIEQYARDAKNDGAALVVFPEASMRAFGNTLHGYAQELGGPFASKVREIANTLGITIVLGMFTPGSEGKVRNTLLVTGPEGESHYDKIHLYDAFNFAESDTVEPGTTPVIYPMQDTILGITTCYDIRFPKLYTENAKAGAQINIISASWGTGPGKVEQWRLLARARALDSTSFILACGQGDPTSIGRDDQGAPTGVGHSLVVSPMGEILGELGAEPGLLVMDIDLEQVDIARKLIPVLENAKL